LLHEIFDRLTSNKNPGIAGVFVIHLWNYQGSPRKLAVKSRQVRLAAAQAVDGATVMSPRALMV